jgi:hypothetical protein
VRKVISAIQERQVIEAAYKGAGFSIPVPTWQTAVKVAFGGLPMSIFGSKTSSPVVHKSLVGSVVSKATRVVSYVFPKPVIYPKLEEFLRYCVYTPVLEESLKDGLGQLTAPVCKRGSVIGHAAFALYEYVGKLQAGLSPLLCLYPAVMHVAISQLSWGNRVATHAGWNYGVLNYVWKQRDSQALPMSLDLSSHLLVHSLYITGLVDPVLEEIIKSFSSMYLGEKAHVAFAVAEYGFKVYSGMDCVTSLLPMAVHCGIRQRPFLSRVCIHAGWNCGAVVLTHLSKDRRGQSLLDDMDFGPIVLDSKPGYKCNNDLRPMEEECKITVRYEGRKLTECDAVKLMNDLESKPREAVFCNSIAFPPYIPSMQEDTPHNFYVGLRNRVMQKQAFTPCWDRWLPLSGVVLSILETTECDWIDFDLWAARYDGAQRVKLMAAFDDMIENGYEDLVFVIEAFLKKELNHTFEFISDEQKDPRNISPPNDQRIKVLVGTYFYSISKYVNTQWDGQQWNYCPFINGDVCVLSHSGLDLEMKVSQLERFARCAFLAATTLRSRRGVFIAVAGDDSWMLVSAGNGRFWLVCSDGKRWDASLRDLALAMQRSVDRKIAKDSGYSGVSRKMYDETLGGIKDVEMVDDMSTGTPFKTTRYEKDYGIVFSGLFPGIRLSGRQDTSHGNGIVNVGGSLSVAKDVLDLCDKNLDTEKTVAQAVTTAWNELGWGVEVHVSVDPLSGDFCSSRIIPVNGVWHCIPKPGKFMTRFGFSVSNYRTLGEVQAIVRQFKCFVEVPFIGDLLKRIEYLLSFVEIKHCDVPEEFLFNSHYGTSYVLPPPGEDTWKWFNKTYGIDSTARDVFRRKLEMVDYLPFSLPVDVETPLFDTDLGLFAKFPLLSEGVISGLKICVDIIMSTNSKKTRRRAKKLLTDEQIQGRKEQKKVHREMVSKAAPVTRKPVTELVSLLGNQDRNELAWMHAVVRPDIYSARIPVGQVTGLTPVNLYKTWSIGYAHTSANSLAFITGQPDDWDEEAGGVSHSSLHVNGGASVCGGITSNAYAGLGFPASAAAFAAGSVGLNVADVSADFTTGATTGTRFIQVGFGIKLSADQPPPGSDRFTGNVHCFYSMDPQKYPIAGQTPQALIALALEEGSRIRHVEYKITGSGLFVEKDMAIRDPESGHYEDAGGLSELFINAVPNQVKAYEWNRIGQHTLLTTNPLAPSVAYCMEAPSNTSFVVEAVMLYQTEKYASALVGQPGQSASMGGTSVEDLVDSGLTIKGMSQEGKAVLPHQIAGAHLAIKANKHPGFISQVDQAVKSGQGMKALGAYGTKNLVSSLAKGGSKAIADYVARPTPSKSSSWTGPILSAIKTGAEFLAPLAMALF